MIIQLFIYALGFIVGAISRILPTISIWPAEFLEGVAYFGEKIMLFNFIFPIYEATFVIAFIFDFLILFYSAYGLLMVLNFIRGSGKLEV